MRRAGGIALVERKDDKARMQAIARGDKDSMETLFNEYKTNIFRYVMSQLQDYQSAEDVTQEVFINVFRFAGQYKACADVKTWIFAIAKNAVNNYWRKNKSREHYLTLNTMSEQMTVNPESAGDFYDIIARLDKPSRDVVSLHLIAGLKHREIAAILGEQESTVKQRYSRALKWLRHYLSEEESGI